MKVTIRRHAVKAGAMAIAARRVAAARMVRTVIVDREKRVVAQVRLMPSVVQKAVVPKVVVVMGVEVLAIRTIIAVQVDAVPRQVGHKRVAPKVAAVRMVLAADATNQTSKHFSCGLISTAMAC
jgi:hypothetical protein